MCGFCRPYGAVHIRQRLPHAHAWGYSVPPLRGSLELRAEFMLGEHCSMTAEDLEMLTLSAVSHRSACLLGFGAGPYCGMAITLSSRWMFCPGETFTSIPELRRGVMKSGFIQAPTSSRRERAYAE